MKLWLKLALNSSGFDGLLSNHRIKQSLDLTYQRREICLLHREVYCWFNQSLWQTFSSNRRWHIVSSSMSVSETKSSLHSPFEKSIIERTIQYIKDRTESFDDYFPCKRKNCKLKHVTNWLKLFVDYHNKEKSPKWTEPNIYLI